MPSGDLAVLFERALDELIDRETRRRMGATKPRKARLVWERDGGQCTFVDQHGRRCTERRFVTIEHRHPFALGGSSDLDNLCLLCSAHNAHTARQVFGDEHIAQKQLQRTKRKTSAKFTSEVQKGIAGAAPDLYDKVQFALRKLGFREREARKAVAELRQAADVASDIDTVLRTALQLLTPSVA